MAEKSTSKRAILYRSAVALHHLTEELARILATNEDSSMVMVPRSFLMALKTAILGAE